MSVWKIILSLIWLKSAQSLIIFIERAEPIEQRKKLTLDRKVKSSIPSAVLD